MNCKPLSKPLRTHTRIEMGECGECGRTTRNLYQRCPITGRLTSAVWCKECYERASLRSFRDASLPPVAIKRAA